MLHSVAFNYLILVLFSAHMKPAELKALRKQAGLTQEALASLLNKSRMTIQRWESGQVKLDKTKALAIRAVIREWLSGAGK